MEWMGGWVGVVVVVEVARLLLLGLHLPYISPTSPLHLPYISPKSPRRAFSFSAFSSSAFSRSAFSSALSSSSGTASLILPPSRASASSRRVQPACRGSG